METKNLYVLLILLLMSCSNAQNPVEELKEPKPDEILIVYLSRTKNTKAVGEIIHENVGGDLVELELQNPYPENYRETVDQVSRELESGFLPPLKTKIENIEKYKVVFVGFPTWSMALPPPMKSFLKQYNLEGKTIIPFNTNAGYGVGSGFETVKELCPNSTVTEGYSTRGGVERDGILFVMEGDKAVAVKDEVQNWLQKIGIIQK